MEKKIVTVLEKSHIRNYVLLPMLQSKPPLTFLFYSLYILAHIQPT